MSAIMLRVTGGKVICRDRESDSPYDSFRLAGAVIVDGQPHAFALDTVGTNETIQTDLSGYTLWEGTSPSTTIGLAMRGYDVDNNSKWRNNREDIIKWNNLLADQIDKAGISWAAAVIEAWPDVVDKFVEWDHDDLLLSAATTVELPEPSRIPGDRPPPTYEVSARGRGQILQSKWDYEVFVRFIYVTADAISYPPQAQFTYKPTSAAYREEWVGTWESTREHVETTAAKISVKIHSSSTGPGFDVWVTERGNDPHEFEFLGVPAPREPGEIVGLHPVSPEDTQGSVVTPSGGIVIPPFTFPDDEPDSGITVASPIGQVDPHEGIAVSEGINVKGAHEIGEDRPTFDSVALKLGTEAALELFHIAIDGKKTNLVALRYLRPVGGPHRVLVGGSVNEMLHRIKP